MDDAYVVAIEGISDPRFAGELNPRILLAAQRAVNRTTERTRTNSSRRIRSQVNFSASYLGPDNGRLSIVKKASADDLEAVIRGRQRPTSLAQFMVGSPRIGRQGVRVQVKPGQARFMKRVFPIKLRAGTASIDTKFNLGLAIRLRPGERVRNKHEMIRVAKNLYVLYGPSVDQVFATVSNDVMPEAADFLESEFVRLMGIDQ